MRRSIPPRGIAAQDRRAGEFEARYATARSKPTQIVETPSIKETVQIVIAWTS
jgi:hypothetical protein